jgi:autotransporter-associated beta strand protein
MTVNNSAGNYTITGAGKIAVAGSLTKTGADTLTLGAALSVTGTTSIAGGTLKLATGASGGSGPAVTSAINLASLSITGSGVLDVNNNHLIITYGSSDPISTIAGYLQTGYNGGTWNGPGGIDTSAPLTVSRLRYGLGYADGANGVVHGLSSGQIEVAYTLLGDAVLDGVVNSVDLAIVAANYNQSVTGWDQGDFNYVGVVNSLDLTDVVVNYNQGVSGAASAGDLAALDAFAAANGVSLPPSSVPEPESLGLFMFGSTAILARRRRRRRLPLPSACQPFNSPADVRFAFSSFQPAPLIIAPTDENRNSA